MIISGIGMTTIVNQIGSTRLVLLPSIDAPTQSNSSHVGVVL